MALSALVLEILADIESQSGKLAAGFFASRRTGSAGMDFYQQLVEYADQLDGMSGELPRGSQQDGPFIAPELPLEQPPKQAPAKKGKEA